MTRGLEGKSVKSARRVLEVLEYFSTGPTEVTVMEMSRALDYPQSSTSELLSSLVTLGYLNHDRRRRTFRPTVRVAAIGSAVGPEMFRRGAMMDVVDDVHMETGATVVVGMAQRGVLHIVHVAGCTQPIRQRTPGPLLHSALGQALLSGISDPEVRSLIHRLNAEAGEGQSVAPAAYLETIAEVRARGYALAPCHGGEMLATILPHARPDSLAIGVVIPQDATLADHQEILACLRRAFRHHLAPSSTTRQEPLAAVAAMS
ncbi:helix-turn-helix domain-containing protein [Sphingobium sp. HBC34]|uniref:Helix-turn-helix domain-containing protein n=1 Tax=Sphingobium cyanobacteriorum TaxID=3063954 RepID=A0ABT8ZPD4_9SPHN|nr:helix-turn-helix domain-containing protein [Sphingobium sp. HBC34]MDO7836356.1 helix-turn-helix domain-containing protein [Sphingobium sp. HBC34]